MSTIILFEENQVRRAWNQTEEKWYFAIVDVIAILTESANIKDYIKKLHKRDIALEAYWGTNCPLVAMPGADGKIRPIRAANTEGLLRIIQSIPSPKAEPFKLWLARVGYERLEEIKNPKLYDCRHNTFVYCRKTISPSINLNPNTQFLFLKIGDRTANVPPPPLHSRGKLMINPFDPATHRT